jgi:bifunctional non-homologous end joining protein LigD
VALDLYRKKRKFGVTSEPRGHKARRTGDAYVIQKHAARRLHYDLRLELDGVMKSWAVTRGPSLDPGEKRLAVQVEDHPIEYNKFEGTIPQGEYGGGTVMIWDRGHWTPEGDPHKGLAKGHLDFILEGEKLHGRWHLVRMRRRNRDRHDNWLLIKGKDDAARGPRDKDILDQEPLSAASGRSMDEITAGKGRKRVWHSNRPAKTSPANKSPAKSSPTNKKVKAALEVRRAETRRSAVKQGRGAKLPDFVPPSLATLHAGAPAGKEWLHEIKLDGYRIEARLDRGNVRLLTRKGLDWTHRFKPIAEAVAALPAETALIDGELVVEDERGASSFSLLQTDLKEGRGDRLVYNAFDLLHLDGRDLTGEPLLKRKEALQRLLEKNGHNGRIRYTEHFDGNGPVVFKHACAMKLEGIVSKLATAPYRSGRTENFVKTKCHDAQEFIVAGYTPASDDPRAVGAITVAVHENGKLRYAGRIGTGFTHKTARDLAQRLERLKTKMPPVALPPDERRKDVIWVKPQMVVEAEFRGVTHGGVLRQASFKGLREDKPASEVVREIPALRTAPPAAAMPQRQAVRKSASRPASRKSARGARASAEVGNVHLTHPGRIYWADAGVSKEDLAEYYVGVWDFMAQHVVDRPLAIVRGPEGTEGELFFQKHIASNIKSSPLRHQVVAKEHDVIAVEKLDDIIALVQSGALEIHVRGSRLGQLEICDRIVFDLDPGDGVPWKAVIAAAKETQDRLAALKLKSFAKLTGGKGIHVMVPIEGADWDTAKAFTQKIVLAMAADSPKLYLAKMTKALREGKIFIDYFRNSREATSVCAYSTRARAGAPVSAPVSWEALGRTTGGNQFTVLNLRKHLKSDAWADIGKVRQKLPK